MSLPVQIEDQPISATFFGEGRWLTDFITPDALEVRELYDEITNDLVSQEGKLLACWDWVANSVKYVRFVKAKLWVNGKSSAQSDYWSEPSLTIQTKVGNCAVKSFLLCSLLRNSFPEYQVYVALGNLTSNGVGGHAWCLYDSGGEEYVIEATRGDIGPVLANKAELYEPVVIFNDKTAKVIEGRILKEPLGYCCVDWLRDYLDMNRCDDFIRIR